jgi:hypothetical protein
MLRRFMIFLAVATTAVAATAAPGAAAQQRGLVNVNVENNTIQVPIAVAANICNVTVALLAQDIETASSQCEANAGATAERAGGGGNGNGTNQRGLINLNIEDNVVQIPIGIAANVCNVSAAILAQDLRTGEAECTAVADSDANA